jgi:hypothetical protein
MHACVCVQKMIRPETFVRVRQSVVNLSVMGGSSRSAESE